MLVCHDVGEAGPLGIVTAELDALCRAIAGDRRVWVAPVAEVAERINSMATPSGPPP